MLDIITVSELTALLSVLAIDIALAGDNAIVVGMAAAGLEPELRRRAIFIGIAAAAILRIVFAAFTVQLLQIIGLMVAGGLLLLWVSWKLWRELRENAAQAKELAVEHLEDEGNDAASGAKPRKSMREAVTQILVADVTMSLDNVIAVAGAAREHAWVLVVGLALSVALMGFAATFIARLLHRFSWIAYVGLAIIVYVAITMIWDGSLEVMAVI